MKILNRYLVLIIMIIIAFSCQSNYQFRGSKNHTWSPSLEVTNSEKFTKKNSITSDNQIFDNIEIGSKLEPIKIDYKITEPQTAAQYSIPEIPIKQALQLAKLTPKKMSQVKQLPKEVKKNVQEMKSTFLGYEGPNEFITYGLYSILAGATLFLLGLLLFFILTNGTMSTTNAAIGFPLGLLMAAGIFLFFVGVLMWLLGWIAYGLGIY